jgi:hypothetical protein
MKTANRKHDLIYFKIFDLLEKKIDVNYPAILVKDLKSSNIEVFNFENKKFIQSYNKLRVERIKAENKIINKNRIDILNISTDSNIYKELLLFFRQRALKQ